nr:uncharacterized mitochondrial protein AtMg00810-like [Tanacetum cinerariifolium]
CGGGVAAESSLSNGSVSSADGAWSAAVKVRVVSALAPQGQHTINMGLWHPKDYGFELIAFSDADHVGCLDIRKSTSGEIQFLGDKLVSWMSMKHDCTAMSSAEVEYVALSASCA